MKTIVVLDLAGQVPDILSEDVPNLYVMDAQQFLSTFPSKKKEKYRVINLCDHYRYMSKGYYCSLLAESKQMKVMPSAKTILDLQDSRIYKIRLSELNGLLRRAMSKFDIVPGTTFELKIFMGRCQVEYFKEFARAVFNEFRAPLLSVTVHKPKDYCIKRITFEKLDGLTDEENQFFQQSLVQYLKSRWRDVKHIHLPNFSLAILVNPHDPLPPSNAKALAKFESVGRKMNVDVQFIQKQDFDRLMEFDALFIRETTLLTNHTYRFSLKAEKEGIPVLDTPTAILRCTNKIFMHDLFRQNQIPSLPTQVFMRHNMEDVLNTMSFPIVLKVPDGNFSTGIFKVTDEKSFFEVCDQLFPKSELLIAQAFMRTDFDWRIGVLYGTPIFVCRYWMVSSHWQIYKHGSGGKVACGNSDCLELSKVDPALLDLAVKCAKLVDSSLFGVDIKQTDAGYFVMEVNDNPNLDAGVEDVILKDQLYGMVISEFQKRVEQSYSGGKI